MESEIKNKTITCADKYQKHSSAYGIKVKEKNLSTSKKMKSNGVVMFVSINVANNSTLQPLNSSAHHKKRPSIR